MLKLTMPFWTLNPSWYFRSGLLISTVVTGGQLTMFIFTWTWFFKPCKHKIRQNFTLACQEYSSLIQGFKIYEWQWEWHEWWMKNGKMNAHFYNTLIIPWQVARGSPTRLVLLMDMIWSPILSFPERAAGPPFIMLAKITVGKMEPQPDSTMTTPRISPLLFSNVSCRDKRYRWAQQTDIHLAVAWFTDWNVISTLLLNLGMHLIVKWGKTHPQIK